MRKLTLSMPKLLATAFFIVLTLALLPLSVGLAAPKPVKTRANPGQIIEQIEFRDVAVGDALRILAEQSNLNIIASKKAADIPVTMFLRRVTSIEVIEALAKTYNLWYQRDEDSNIVRIYTVEEYVWNRSSLKRKKPRYSR